MADPRVENLAKILVHHSTKIQPGDRVDISASAVAAPLVREVYREVIRAGGHPYPRLAVDGLAEIFYEEASDEQLSHVNEWERMAFEEFEASIFLFSQTNTHALSNVPTEKQGIVRKARGPMLKRYSDRSAAGEYRWVISMYPTDAYAQDADMSLADFENYVYQTTFADQPDPVEKWQAIHDEQQAIVEFLKGKKSLEVTGPNIDMRLSIEGREFKNSDGHLNLPDGEVYTSPVEDSVEGWVRFTYPSVTLGVEVEGHELHFEQGKVVKASARKNEDFLLQMLDTDEGARYLGEFAIGTNKMIDRFIKNILFDEKIGGTIHMAIGRGFPHLGGKNESAIHWDMICDMRDGGEIKADGELFYRSGEFMV